MAGISANALRGTAEFVKMKAAMYTPEGVRLPTQQQLRSLQSAVNAATKNGIQYEKIMIIDGWELKFGQPRNLGQLPVLFHARPI